MNTNNLLFVSIVTVIATLLAGCGGPTRVPAPEFDAEAAATKAMSDYDTNGDGQLDEGELKACMALGGAIGEIDEDGDGQISEAEIKARVEYFVSNRVGRESLACVILKNKRPLSNAIVTFEPEPFMGDMIRSASGTTDRTGLVIVNIDDELGGIQPGFYKVVISRPSSSGKESINKKYNEETIIGQEVTTGSIQLAEGLTINIK